MDYKYIYDEESDVLNIYEPNQNVEESIEVSENVVLDLDKNGQVNGIEIMDASEFLESFNPEMDKKFLSSLDFAGIEYKIFRNQFILLIVLRSGEKHFIQPMPPLRRSEYVSPLISSAY